MDGGSVTTWFALLEVQQDQAAQQLWERYFPRLLDVARHKMTGLPRQTADEEDVALSAFHTFCQAAKARRIPRVASRDDLWRTLVLITAAKVVDRRRYLGSKKRSQPCFQEGPKVAATAALLDEVIGQEPDPAFAAQLAENFDLLIERLGDSQLRQTALAKLEGYTHEEIAARLNCSVRTVQRRLTVIRRIWEQEDSHDSTRP